MTEKLSDTDGKLVLLDSVESEVATPILCPNCKTKTNFNLGPNEERNHSGATKLAIGHCQVCNYPVYMGLDNNNDAVWYYPSVVSVPPDGLPERVHAAFQEALKCLSAGVPNAALLMCRRAIQETMNDKEAKKGNLPAQLDDLVANQKITPSLRDWATHAQIGGRIAAHGTGGGQWGDPDQIWGDMEDAEAVALFCHAFFEYLYTLEERNKQFMTKHAPPAEQ